MALDSYDNLKIAIAQEIDRDDLDDKIDDFIDLAEELHRDGGREDPLPPVRIREMIERVPVTIDARYLALPDGYLQAQILRILTNEAGEEITPYDLNEVNIFELTRRRTGFKRPPKFYTNQGTEIEFEAEPDQSYGGEFLYYKAVEPLSATNQTNVILQRSPRAYLYGACLSSAPFLMHDERIATWSNLYSSAAAGMRKSDQAAKYTGPLFTRVAGTTP